MTNKKSWGQGKLPEGFKAVITGASTGIGRALALQFARDYKAQLLLNARGADDLEKTADDVRKAGGKAACVVGDVSDGEICAKILSECKSEFGSIDILVNNAGLTRGGPLKDLSIEDWRYVFEVNFFAALNLTYGVLPSFLEQGYGKIVNVASIAGKISFPGTVCYASSKFALTGFSEGMAAELSREIDVITVCPGWVRTEFFKKNQTNGDPSAIAKEDSALGWMMKNILSISSEQAADDISRALRKGGSHELILTAPAIVIERMSGLFPEFTHYLSSLVPANRDKLGTKSGVK